MATLKTNVYLTEHQLTRIRRASALTGLRQTEIIRRTIDAHLDEVVRAIVQPLKEEKSNAQANDNGRPHGKSL